MSVHMYFFHGCLAIISLMTLSAAEVSLAQIDDLVAKASNDDHEAAVVLWKLYSGSSSEDSIRKRVPYDVALALLRKAADSGAPGPAFIYATELWGKLPLELRKKYLATSADLGSFDASLLLILVKSQEEGMTEEAIEDLNKFVRQYNSQAEKTSDQEVLDRIRPLSDSDLIELRQVVSGEKKILTGDDLDEFRTRSSPALLSVWELWVILQEKKERAD